MNLPEDTSGGEFKIGDLGFNSAVVVCSEIPPPLLPFDYCLTTFDNCLTAPTTAYRSPVFKLPIARPPNELFGVYAAKIPIRHIGLSALDRANVLSEGVIHPPAGVIAVPAVFSGKGGTKSNGLVLFFFSRG